MSELQPSERRLHAETAKKIRDAGCLMMLCECGAPSWWRGFDWDARVDLIECTTPPCIRGKHRKPMLNQEQTREIVNTKKGVIQ